MATKRSSDDLVDKASHKAEEDGKKKRPRSGSKPKNPKPKPGLHNSGASSPPSTEGNKKQLAVHLPLEEQSPREPGEIYTLLQAAVVEVGVELPAPEIVAIGGQSHGKSSLLEALLGFRLNAGDDEMGIRRPLFLQMRHDSTAIKPKFRFQEENYEIQVVKASDIASLIKRHTESHLEEIKAAVSDKPIIIRAEFAGWPNFTIIDTPGLANSGGKEDTTDKIMKIVKSLATPNRLVLFCQHISQQICPNMLEMLKMFVPTFRRTVIVLFMFDNELKQSSKEEVHTLFKTTSMKLETSIHPFFVVIPKHHGPQDGGMFSRDDFLRQICKLDNAVRDIGLVNEDASRIGLSCLMDHLKSEIDTMYRKIVAPTTLALLQEWSTEASEKLLRLETKKEAMSSVSKLRASAMRYTHSFYTHLHALLDGAKGKITADELSAIDIHSWPSINDHVQPADSTLKLYGVLAFERVMNEFSLATKSMSSPPLEMDQVGNIVLSLVRASAGSIEVDKAGAEVARTRARSGLAPLIHTACDQLESVLKGLFDLAREQMHKKDSEYQNIEHIDVFPDFLVALRRSYDKFIVKLSNKCKQTVQHDLDSAISTYSYTFNENEAQEDNNVESEDLVLEYRRKDNAIPKITGNAYIEKMYPDILAASGRFFAEIRDDLIKKDTPTKLRSGFLNPCCSELLPAFFNELFVKDDAAFVGMFDTYMALNTINKERKSLLKRQKSLMSCQESIRNISESWWLSGS